MFSHWKTKMDAVNQFKNKKRNSNHKKEEHKELFGEYTLKTLMNSFSEFDKDGNSYISINDLSTLYKELNIPVNDAILQEIMKLLDKDGDGQVAIDEFVNFTIDNTGGNANHPKVKEIVKHKVKTQTREEDKDDNSALLTVSKDVQTKTINRAKQYHLYESRFIFQSILQQHHIDELLIQKALNKCLTNAKTLYGNESNDFVEFQFLCDVLHIEHKTKSRILLSQMVHAKSKHSMVPFRGVLLGFFIWVCRNHLKKVDFAFRIFDRDESGDIEFIELLEILFATNPAATSENDMDKMVKKARFIIKQCDIDHNNVIDAQEFRFVAKKFPNLIFPIY